jgi:hypothetical protein
MRLLPRRESLREPSSGYPVEIVQRKRFFGFQKG